MPLPLALDLPLAIDLDGLADLFGQAQPGLSIYAGSLAVILALLLCAAVAAHLRRTPAERIIHKRAGR
jgi:hypothetical protein